MVKSLILFVLSMMALLIACETSRDSAPANDPPQAAPIQVQFTPRPTATPLPTPTPIPTPVPITTTTFKIGSGSTYEIHFDVQEGTVIEYSFTSNLDFNFSVLDPLGNVVTRAGRVIADQGRVRADKFGRYTLLFDNGFSIFASKTVTIEYRVVPTGGR